MENIIRIRQMPKTFRGLIMLVLVIIYITIFPNFTSYYEQENQQASVRGVITTLIRSTNRSVLLTINMIHSIIEFYPVNDGYLYPFLIFHDENFTSAMRQQILSCVLQNDNQLQISFALVDFRTKVQVSTESRFEKPIGYRLMCRFWTYDIFYHPLIIHGQYDYLMRMDDDSYFSNIMKRDPFIYIASRKLDYIYRSTYVEPFTPMEPILKRFIQKTTLRRDCIYNNFFVIRLKWFYESKPVQNFVRELMYDDLMLREYVGDGCAHSAILEVDNHVKVERISDMPYGHNYHLMPKGYRGMIFREVNGFEEEMNKSCRQLTVLRHSRGIIKRIKIS
ncbi:unnamed protein product [Rotaria socialis]